MRTTLDIDDDVLEAAKALARRSDWTAGAVTDRYLLALAVRNGGRFVSFDRSVRPPRVAEAGQEHVVQLRG